jgi:hypothetical protein
MKSGILFDVFGQRENFSNLEARDFQAVPANLSGTWNIFVRTMPRAPQRR